MNQPSKEGPPDGVSRPIKVFVILLTVVTVGLGFLLLGKIIINVTSPAKKEAVHGRANLLALAEKLETVGLKEKALEQYKKFLEQTSAAPKERARVAVKIADLYAELDNCPDSLVWLYRVELAHPEFFRLHSLNTKIDTCRQRLKLPTP